MVSQRLFTQKIGDLQVCRAAAKEQIKGRVLFPRDGRAGSTDKWECWFIDDSPTNPVLLIDAWGPQIAEAKKQLQDGKVYALTGYQVVAKGKATAFGSAQIKVTFKKGIVIKDCDDAICPTSLPTTSLPDIAALRSSRLVSCQAAIHSTGIVHERQVNTGTTKTVANVKVKAGTVDVEFAAWGAHSQSMAEAAVDDVFCFDAVLAVAEQQTDGSRSVKLTTLDCTRITPADTDTTKAVLDAIPAGGPTTALTTRVWAAGDNTASLTQKCEIHNLGMLRILAAIAFNPSTAGSDEVIDETVEVPTLLVIAARGVNSDNPESLAYCCCPSCNKRLDEDNHCKKCGTDVPTDKLSKRYLAHLHLGDPSACIDAVAHHDCLTEFATKQQLPVDDVMSAVEGCPLVARLRIRPDKYKPGEHVMEIIALAKSSTETGVLNVFRSTNTRFPSSSHGIPPLTPDMVTVNNLGQSVVETLDIDVNYCRLLLVINGKAKATVEEGVDGMTCERLTACAITKTPARLYQCGSLEKCQDMYGYRSGELVSVLCSHSGRPDTPEGALFAVVGIYLVKQGEESDRMIKMFKYELEAVTSYYRAQPTLIIPDTAATAKRQLTETTMGQSPEWSTPKRRLRLNVTDEFGKSGTSAMT